jgi:hypothetical protein
MAEENKAQQTGPAMTDTHELQSTRTHAQQAAGAVAGEYRGQAEQILDDARHQVRTFRENADMCAKIRLRQYSQRSELGLSWA